MKNKQYLFFSLTFLCSIFLRAQDVKPNILFIAIDDLKPTVGAFGDDFAVTPNIDKLAKTSTIFLNNHTQQAVCGPSRASLMTGKRPDYTKVHNLKTKMRDINPDILTIPQYFKQQGYITVGTGKIYDPRCVDKFIDKPSWSVPYIKEYNLPFPKEYGSPAMNYYQNKEIKAKIASLIAEAKEKGKNPSKYVRNRYKPPFETSDAPDDAYMDGAIAKHAIELLGDLGKDKSQPFFLAVGFKRPHLPFVASQKYWDLYNPKDIDLACFQKKATNSPGIAYHNSGELRSYLDDEIEYKLNDENLLVLDKRTQRKLIHGYYASVSFVDTQIGKIMKKLKEMGLDKNTIIVVWGDHGWHLGDHSLWNKHSVFEQSTRSPLMIYLPDSKETKMITSPTEFVDIFPTLCDVSGLKIPSNLDGTSLKPIIEGEKTKVKKHAVSQQPRGKDKLGYSFRTDKYRYTAWVGNSKNSTENIITSNDIIYEELYDYENDPLETISLIKNKKYATILKELRADALAFFTSEYNKGHKRKVSKIINDGKSIKQLLSESYNTDSVFIGATLNHSQLNTSVSDLFLKEFTYSTPENCAKQQKIHPKPNKWDWSQLDDYLKFCEENKITVRLHGPISPQVSKWAKKDSRTAKELERNMTEYLLALSQRYNNHKAVRWMDVVNETVGRDGDWFKDKPGVDQWENPWVKMGYDKLGVPLYITKAFEIANKNAPNISQVYNQHGGMEPKMWERVKRTILYLRNQGYRVDGIGWQAHLKSSETLMLDEESLNFLSELIDWAHEHQLEFHVTEIDYKLLDNNNSSEALKKQSKAYSNVLRTLLSKRKTGVVTFNTWGMVDKNTSKHTDMFRFIFDKNGKPKPTYFAIKETLKNNN